MPCKLCGAATEFRFSVRQLGRFDAAYHACSACGCLQVPSPDWLDEAYGSESWALDTGLIGRNLLLAGTVGTVLGALELGRAPVLDYGGGTGLLTRLLRDLGWNAWCFDPYRKPVFVDAFHFAHIPADLGARVLIASEVFEHFTDPRQSLETLLRTAPLIIFTTELYSGQGADWWYLAPLLGQHVFFFSAAALDAVARANGFRFVDTGFLKYFVHESLLATPAEAARLEQAINRAAQPNAAATLLATHVANPFAHVGADYAAEMALRAQRIAERS